MVDMIYIYYNIAIDDALNYFVAYIMRSLYIKKDYQYSFRHLQMFSTHIFLLNQSDRQTKTSAHLPVPLMWRVRGEDGAPVNLSLNGTLGPCSVQWHLEVQP